MKINFNRPLLFTIFSCFAFLHLVLFPCACLAQEAVNQSDTESSHDCCDKSSKKNDSTTKKCSACDNCIDARDCFQDINYSPSVTGLSSYVGFFVSEKITLVSFQNLYFKDYNINFLVRFKQRSIGSSSTFPILLNRWLI